MGFGNQVTGIQLVTYMSPIFVGKPLLQPHVGRNLRRLRTWPSAKHWDDRRWCREDPSPLHPTLAPFWSSRSRRLSVAPLAAQSSALPTACSLYTAPPVLGSPHHRVQPSSARIWYFSDANLPEHHQPDPSGDLDRDHNNLARCRTQRTALRSREPTDRPARPTNRPPAYPPPYQPAASQAPVPTDLSPPQLKDSARLSTYLLPLPLPNT